MLIVTLKLITYFWQWDIETHVLSVPQLPHNWH